MDSMLKWAILFLLIGIPVFSDEIDKTCELDGTCDGATSFADGVDSGNGCLDDNDECLEWVTQGLCEKDQHFMYRHCRKSCDACNKEIPNQEDEYGIVQIMDRDRQVEMQQAIDEMKEYFRKAREDPNTTPKMHEILDNCKLRHDSCAFWMVIGECEKV
jgi:ShK domain-like